MSLSAIIPLALGAGITVGAVLHEFFPTWVEPLNINLLTPLGQVFLRSIQFVVIPIVFSSLLLALGQNSSNTKQHTAKLLISYICTSTIAVGLGIFTAIIIHPGADASMAGLVRSQIRVTEQSPDLIAWFVGLVPTNPLEAIRSGNLIQIIFSSVLIGMGIRQSGDQAKPFILIIESIYVISEKVLSLILYTAPVGIFALISSVIAVQGINILSQLLTYMISSISAIALMMGVYIIFLVISQVKILHFFRSFSDSLILAFGTASSKAVLPIALQNAKEIYGLSPIIANLAIPLGTALKHDGIAVGYSFNALFVAQLYDVPITPSLIITIFLSTFLVSFSAAGVPGTGMVLMVTIFTVSGLPLEGVAILAGIDQLMDSFRTLLNVLGTISHAVILGKGEPSSTVSEASVTPVIPEVDVI
jgi:proton glutamate symport protein